MSSQEIHGLVIFAVLSVPLLSLTAAIFGDRVPFVRLRRPRDPQEPPLWGWAEIIMVIGCWCFFLLFASRAVVPLVTSGVVGDALGVVIIQTVATAMTGVVIYVLLRRLFGQPWTSVGFVPTGGSNLVTALVLWLITLIPIQALYLIWNLILRLFFGHETVPQELVKIYETCVENRDWVAVGLFMVSGVIVAPLAEEVIFRGVFYGPLRLRWGILVGATVSSGVFAVAHWSASAFLPLFALGCLLCYLRERTGSLYPAMVFHAVFNGATFLVHL